MNVQQIREYIAGGEGLHCEFKEAVNKLPRNLMETVCAFLNADGGYIFLGISDDGTITGVDMQSVEKLKSDLVNLANNPQKIDSSYILFPDEIKINDKTIIVVQVPVSSQLHKSAGEIYLRSEDGDYRVHGTHLLAGVINRKMGMFSEQRPIPQFTIQDLRPDLFERAKRLMRANQTNHPWAELEPEQLLKIAGFYTKKTENGEPCLNLAAILMFGNDLTIQKAAPAYVFDCLLRRNKVERYDDRVQIRTNLIEAYDQMMGFVEKHLNDPFYLEGTQRISLRDKIFREAISNIISHREYLHGSPARLMIYRDHVIFDNPCTQHYMGEITLDNLEPFLRNPVICRFMIQLGRFDRLGSGVRNINHYLPLYVEGATPLFEERERGFRLTIPLASQKKPEVIPETEVHEGVYDGVHDGVHNRVHDRVHEELNKTELSIIQFLASPKSTPELLDHLGYKTRTRNYESAIRRLLEISYIEMTIPEKPRSKNQKYRRVLRNMEKCS